jgi:hypothetical protein
MDQAGSRSKWHVISLTSKAWLKIDNGQIALSASMADGTALDHFDAMRFALQLRRLGHTVELLKADPYCWGQFWIKCRWDYAQNNPIEMQYSNETINLNCSNKYAGQVASPYGPLLSSRGRLYRALFRCKQYWNFQRLLMHLP